MHVVDGQQNKNINTHTIFSMRALIDINGLTSTDFLSQQFIKEVCFLFMLAESMLKNTITNIPPTSVQLCQHGNILLHTRKRVQAGECLMNQQYLKLGA